MPSTKNQRISPEHDASVNDYGNKRQENQLDNLKGYESLDGFVDYRQIWQGQIGGKWIHRSSLFRNFRGWRFLLCLPSITNIETNEMQRQIPQVDRQRLRSSKEYCKQECSSVLCKENLVDDSKYKSRCPCLQRCVHPTPQPFQGRLHSKAR